jgi:hypothetical protein
MRRVIKLWPVLDAKRASSCCTVYVAAVPILKASCRKSDTEVWPCFEEVQLSAGTLGRNTAKYHFDHLGASFRAARKFSFVLLSWLGSGVARLPSARLSVSCSCCEAQTLA